MKKAVIPFIIIILLLASGCANNRFQAQIDEQAEAINTLEKIINDKEAQIADLKQQLDDAQKEPRIPALPDGITAEDLKQDLFKRTDLIPFKGVLGGTPNYYSEEFIFLSNNYVFTNAEDGHIGAYMILTYSIKEDNSIDWKLIMHDINGEGWKLVKD